MKKAQTLDQLIADAFNANEKAEHFSAYFPTDYLRLNQIGNAKTKASLRLVRFVMRHGPDLIRECGGIVRKVDMEHMETVDG